MNAIDTVTAPVRSWWSGVKPSSGAELRSEAVAGSSVAIGSVPDGMAASVLAGVNPVYGLYASFAGPLVGGLSSSTQRMVVTTTGAAALAAGSVLSGVSPADRPGALFLLTVVAGVAMLLAGVFKLGRYTRFVSQSVMTGFLTGVAVNIVFGQLDDLTGAPSEGGTAIERAFNVVANPGEWYLPTLVLGLAALAIVAWVKPTRFGSYAALLALIVPTLVLLLTGTTGVATVNDVGDIPTGVPLPQLPALGDLSFSLVTGALAVAAIVLVQGSGVAESSPNLDGSRSDPNRDFIAQGAANVAAGLFQGQPVGGSVGQTALNVSSGAVTRWAAIISGIWVLLILVVFSGAVGEVVMSSLAAVLDLRRLAVDQIRPDQGRVALGHQLADRRVHHVLLHAVAADRRGGRPRRHRVAAAAAQPGHRRPARRRAAPTRRRQVRGVPRPEGHARPSGGRHRRLRQPVVRRGTHAAAPLARPVGCNAARSGAPVAWTALARSDVRCRAGRLRRSTRTRRRPPDPQRRAESDARQDRTDLLACRVAGAIDVYEASEVIGESTELAIAAGERWLAEHPPVAVGTAEAETATAPRPTISRT